MGGTTADEKNREIVEAREVRREEVVRRRLRIKGLDEMDNFLPPLWNPAHRSDPTTTTKGNHRDLALVCSTFITCCWMMFKRLVGDFEDFRHRCGETKAVCRSSTGSVF